jgi:hypothetical protein
MFEPATLLTGQHPLASNRATDLQVAARVPSFQTFTPTPPSKVLILKELRRWLYPTTRFQNVVGIVVKVRSGYEVTTPGAEKYPIFLLLIVFGNVGLAEGRQGAVVAMRAFDVADANRCPTAGPKTRKADSGF